MDAGDEDRSLLMRDPSLGMMFNSDAGEVLERDYMSSMKQLMNTVKDCP